MWEGLKAESLHLNFPNEFWKSFLIKIQNEDLSENQFWDYKIDFTINQSIPKQNRNMVYQEVLKDFTSFANANSGVLIYGITDKVPRKIKGVKNAEKGIQNIMSVLESKCKPLVQVFPISIQISQQRFLTNCVIFVIPKSSEPIAVIDYKTGNPVFFIRDGVDSKPIRDPTKIGLLYENKNSLKKDSFPVLNVIRKILNFPHSLLIPKELRSQYETSDPLKEKDELIPNLLPLNIPSNIWSAELRVDRKNQWIDWKKTIPFIVRESMIYSICNFTEDKYLSNFINPRSIEEFEVTDWLTGNYKYKRYLVEILNNWVRSLLIYKGLSFCKRTKAFYFSSGTSKEFSWFSGKRKSERQIVHFYYPKDRPDFLYCVRNEAANIFTKLINDTPFLVIRRRLFFTIDGFRPETGERTKKLIHKFTSDPKKSYNLNQRNDFLFWCYFICLKPQEMSLKHFIRRSDKDTGISKRIRFLLSLVKINPPLRLKTTWIPNTEGVEVNFTLENWMKRFEGEK